MNGVMSYIEKGIGNRLKLLLIPGFPLDKSMWASQVSGLSSQAHVIAIDMPGLGATPPFTQNNNNNNNNNITIHDYARSVKELMDYKGINNAVIGGCSWGGYIAFEMWRLYPSSISGMILSNTRMEADREQDKLKRLQSLQKMNTKEDLKAMAKKLMSFAIHKYNSKHEERQAIETAKKSIENASIKGVKDGINAIMNRVDSTNTLSTINVPVLIIAGKYDWGSPFYASQAMHQRINKSQLEIIDSGHLTPIEKPDVVNQTISKFLKDHFPP